MTSNSGRGVGVTGAGGFVGRSLVPFLVRRGFEVHAFQRVPGATPHPGVTGHRFVMPGEIHERDFEGLDALVHGALSEYGPHRRDADQVNLDSARRLIEIARRHDQRLIFLSSLSAHPGAESHYGRGKLEIEALFDPSRDCVLRLGLVLGDGGLFGGIVEVIRGARVIPLPDGGRQPIQILWMGDLLEIIERVIERRIAGRYDVATPDARTMRELYAAVVERLGLRRALVPVPLPLVRLGVATLEALRVPFPVRLENVLGLKCLRAFDTARDMRALGCERAVSFDQAVERLLERPAR